MTDTEIKEYLLSKRHWSSKDLMLLGIPWSYTKNNKGWKTKILKERGWFEEYRAGHFKPKLEKIRAKPEPEPERQQMPESGFLVRSTMTGRYHIIVNGQCLCRQPPNWKRQIVTQKRPDAQCCSLCSGLLETDPNNTRPTNRVRRHGFYSSWEWKKLRFEALKKYGAVCMCCNSVENIVVDHIKPRRFFPELELDPDNLQVLCRDCNMGKSNDDFTDFRPGADSLSQSELDELEIVSAARHGTAGQGEAGVAWLGEAWHGKAGVACHGLVRQGEAGQGKAGGARHGRAWPGGAGRG